MSSKKLTNRQTAEFCRSLSALLHAGINAADACYLLASEESGGLQTLFTQISDHMNAGTSLAEALQLCHCLPVSTTGLIHTGEYTGKLEEALLACAQYHETRDRTARQLRSALGYPFLLLILMLCVIGVLLIQVLPVFASVYASLGASMTGLAGWLLRSGTALKTILPFLLALLLFAGAAILIVHFHKPFNAAFKEKTKGLLSEHKLVREFQNGRFLQALSMGIHGGLMPEDAVCLAASLLEDSPGAAQRCQECLSQIREGCDFADALHNAGLIDGYSCRMLKLGNKTGSTDQVAAELADRMQEQAENHLQDLLSKVEPTLVLVCSILVGLILLSVMLPLMQVLSALG